MLVPIFYFSFYTVLLLRNIEEILAEKGEEIVRVDDSTLEVKGQDIVGSHKLQAALSTTHRRDKH